MSSLQSLRCVASKENAQMMLKHKMSIISASGRPTAKLNPFLESSFRGHFTVADAVLVEATNAGQKIGTVHGRIILFFKRNKRPAIACFHIAFPLKNKVSLNLKICAFLVFTFYEFREKFQVMESNEGEINTVDVVLVHWRVLRMLKKSRLWLLCPSLINSQLN